MACYRQRWPISVQTQTERPCSRRVTNTTLSAPSVHLGVGVQINLLDGNAKLNAAAQVPGDGVHAAVSPKGSLLAPIPVAGPQFPYYLTGSPRLYVEGKLYLMYLLG
jgi:hypothetical protein